MNQPSNQASQPQAYKAIRIQSSAYGTSQTLAYGTNRISGNLIGYWDFTQIAQEQGGK